MIFEEDLKTILFIAGLIFFLSLHSWAQSPYCDKNCPNPAQVDDQFLRNPHQDDKPTDERVWSKKWVGSLLIGAGASSFDKYETASKQNRCVLEGHNGFPEHVTNKELIVEGVIEEGAVVGLASLFRISHPPRWARYFSFGPPAYQTVLHLKGGIEWWGVSGRC